MRSVAPSTRGRSVHTVAAPVARRRPAPPRTELAADRRLALLLAPLLVLASEYPLYQVLTAALGPRLGYFLAFASYWLGWGLLFPLWVVGWQGVRGVFGPARPRLGRPAWPERPDLAA